MELAQARARLTTMEAPVELSKDGHATPEPCLIGPALVLDHGRKRVQLRHRTAGKRNPADRMNEREERSAPRFHCNEDSARTECSSNLGQYGGKILWNGG